MKKAFIYYFYSLSLSKITGYEHNSEIPYDKVFAIAEEIFNKGLNVMITQHSNGITLYVDDKTFKQR